MNKKLFILFLFILSLSSLSEAQLLRVEYYQWTKTYSNDGKLLQTLDGKSGQFVTRTRQVCYDSDKDGCTVGNGSLKLKDQQGDISLYVGPSYYGNPTKYTFYNDKGILNIEDKDGKVYVYKKTTAPSGRKTCSLIRAKTNNNNNSGSATGYVPPVDVGSSSGSSSSSSSNTHQKTWHDKACRQCAGTGKCRTCAGDGIYINPVDVGGKKRCFICGGTGNCRTCNGTGRVRGDYY